MEVAIANEPLEPGREFPRWGMRVAYVGRGQRDDRHSWGTEPQYEAKLARPRTANPQPVHSASAGQRRASPPSPSCFGICPKGTWDDSLSAPRSDCRVHRRSRVSPSQAVPSLDSHRSLRCIKTPARFSHLFFFLFFSSSVALVY